MFLGVLGCGGRGFQIFRVHSLSSTLPYTNVEPRAGFLEKGSKLCKVLSEVCQRVLSMEETVT